MTTKGVMSEFTEELRVANRIFFSGCFEVCQRWLRIACVTNLEVLCPEKWILGYHTSCIFCSAFQQLKNKQTGFKSQDRTFSAVASQL